MAEITLSSCGLLVLSLLVFQLNITLAAGKRQPNKTHNNIVDVKTECSIASINVTITLEEEFQGVVYARGFPLECRALGSRDNTITLHLAASGCGVRITPNPDGGLLYSVVVEIQMAKHLQQVSDPVMPVSCVLSEDKMVLQSHAINIERPKSRNGRMMHEEDEPKPKAWLEIQGSAMSNPHQLNTVSVGEYTTILVKTWLPENISGQVVDCLAHDGLGETSQALVDPAGCPVDEVLVPRLHKSQELSRRQNGYQFIVQTTSFPAFKFPDRESVHIRCGLQLCRQSCQKVDCSSDLRFQHRHQRRLKGEEGEVLDYIQLFNSVEVLAPGIEMENMRQNSHFESSEHGSFSADLLSAEFHDPPFCLSASRMALVFAGLGMVFLAAVAVSLYVLLRNRLLKQTYADSSRLVSRDSLSLIIGQNSRSSLSAWSYGRI